MDGGVVIFVVVVVSRSQGEAAVYNKNINERTTSKTYIIDIKTAFLKNRAPGGCCITKPLTNERLQKRTS